MGRENDGVIETFDDKENIIGFYSKNELTKKGNFQSILKITSYER